MFIPLCVSSRWNVQGDIKPCCLGDVYLDTCSSAKAILFDFVISFLEKNVHQTQLQEKRRQNLGRMTWWRMRMMRVGGTVRERG